MNFKKTTLKNFKEILFILRRFLILPLQIIEIKGNYNISLFIRNTILRSKNLNLRFYFDKRIGLYYLREFDITHYFANRIRGYGLYSNGIKNRVNSLVSSYDLTKIDFKEKDFVIDCGANYADLWIYLKSFIQENNYITFEPGKEEFQAICRNASKARNYNIGLGKKNEVKKFYVNHLEGDSSFIEPYEYSEIEEIKTTTLDKFISENGIKSIKLLKLRLKVLNLKYYQDQRKVCIKIQYIAIDGGYERGINKDETFSEQTNILMENGFKMIAVNFNWGRALFENKKFLS